MRLDGNNNVAESGHAVLGGVPRFLVKDALALVGFCPKLLKQTLADPSMTGARERLCKYTTFDD